MIEKISQEFCLEFYVGYKFKTYENSASLAILPLFCLQITGPGDEIMHA